MIATPELSSRLSELSPIPLRQPVKLPLKSDHTAGTPGMIGNVHCCSSIGTSLGSIIMYERFTDRARKVVQLANLEAQRLNHEYISTEHILLGLVAEGSGVAANVLKNLEVDPGKIREEAARIVQTGPDMITMEKLPQTPRAKKVIEYAMEEAHQHNHNCVRTEHLLLGIARATDSVAAQVLVNLGLNLEDVREEVLRALGPNE
jgi:ATP-dependent Clp protease ATP-binding subunit ClpC